MKEEKGKLQIYHLFVAAKEKKCGDATFANHFSTQEHSE